MQQQILPSEMSELTVYEDGNMATIHLGPPSSEFVGTSRKTVNVPHSRRGGGKRQAVKGCSRGSKRRVLRELAKLQSLAQFVFLVTLTVPDMFLDKFSDLEGWMDRIKWGLKRYQDRLQRRYPGTGFVWVIEYRRRQSGKYAGCLVPHVHLLLFGFDLAKLNRMPQAILIDLRKWTAKTWHDLVGCGDAGHLKAGTQVERVNWQKHRRYLSAYLSKASADPELAGLCLGRWWGICGREHLPWARPVTVLLTKLQGLKLWGCFRWWAHIPDNAQWRLPSLTVFIGANWLLQNLDRLVT